MATVLIEQESNVYDPWGVDWVSVRLKESFEEVAALNPDLRIEQKSNGELFFMSPTGGEGSYRNSYICARLQIWSESFGGRSFDSSVVFCLPDGSKKSPDGSWITLERWNALSKDDRKKFPPICPDFVIELRSETDRLANLEEKLQGYLDNGVRLGWLIDPLKKQVQIYRPGNQPEIMLTPESVSGEDVLPGFMLDLRPIWQDA